jgi:hypothetical protein
MRIDPHHGYLVLDQPGSGCNTKCYTGSMPTQRRRHAVTETPMVEEALNRLRSELGRDRVNLDELVVLGVRAKLSELSATKEAAQQVLRKQLADRVRARDIPADLELAIEVRQSGWSRR